jgi:hypothetical protein
MESNVTKPEKPVPAERKKKVERPKELSGFKSYLHEEDDETDSDDSGEGNVTLRRTGCKSAPSKNKKSSKALVSVGLHDRVSLKVKSNITNFSSIFQAIETGFIPGMLELTDADFIHIPSIQQLTVSDISKIRFSSSSRPPRNDEVSERNVTF